MTASSSDTETVAHPLQEFADAVASAVGGEVMIHFDTVKVRVPADRWVSAHGIARDELDLVFFSWLSSVDWSKDSAAGDPPGEEIDERFEVLSTVADLTEGRRVTFSTDISHDSPTIDSLVEVFAGANWHERETAEMFGIEFSGHPYLEKLYLPEAFIGHPLRKTYPLLSREVKPWPGTVDVEAMPEREEPSTENPEA